MMQYSTFFDRKKAAKANSKPLIASGDFLLLSVKGVVLFLMLYFVWVKIRQGHLSFGQLWQLSAGMYKAHQWYLLLLPLLLVVANWGLEARKWQLLAAPVIPLSMFQATRAVLTGLGMGFITPRSVGDYAGRIIEAPGKGRGRLIGAVMLNRISQSFITCVFGLLGFCVLFYLSSKSSSLSQLWMIFAVFMATGGIFLMLGNGRYWLIALAERFTDKKWVRTIKVLGIYSQKDILRVVFYAFLRYTVFTFQFLLILGLAGVSLPIFLMAAGVASVFLLKSVIPTFNFLSDLGVREFSALWVFSSFAVPESQLLTASLLVWFLNILLPTLIGGVNILRIRLNRF